jgi:hypothetical protein
LKTSRGTHLRRERIPEPGQHEVKVEGETYQWELRHGWGAAPGAGYRGVSVSVWVRRHQTRELILDFPFSTFGQEPPQATKLLAAVERSIPRAIEAGWVPDSRGRAMRYLAEEEG